MSWREERYRDTAKLRRAERGKERMRRKGRVGRKGMGIMRKQSPDKIHLQNMIQPSVGWDSD